jgi:fatty-acyl-CoA synthase
MKSQGIGYWLKKREFLSRNKEAVVDGEKRLTYGELNGRVNRLSKCLMDRGLKKGDRIAMLAYNCAEYIEVIFAAAKLGLILVPLNWRLSPAELAFNIADSGTEAIIFHPEFSETVHILKDQTTLNHMLVLGSGREPGAMTYEDELKKFSPDEPSPDQEVGPESPHIIMYTAGTTGRPKGAVLTQSASLWNALNLEIDMQFGPYDRDLLVLPMFHIGGIGLFTLPMLHVGGSVIIQRTFEPSETINLLKKENITLFFGVPAIFLFLIQYPGFRPEVFENVRIVMSGGAPLPVNLVRQYHDRGIILQQGFGMSEAAPSISTLKKEKALEKAGSIGRALFHVDAMIVDDDMKEVPTGEVGELVISGPNLMDGYWNRPEATEEAFKGGWFHTGDLARMDAEGDIFIVERKKDMFISGGENVYPAEVENAIFELDEVAEAAVIGVKDEKWGEVGKAIIVFKEGKELEEEEIVNFLKERLAKYKVPKSVVVANQLPRNAAGKVLKNSLREEYP